MFPNLPTDNLYKFLCIGGLALVAISLIVLENISTERKTLYDRRSEEQQRILERLTNPPNNYNSAAKSVDSLRHRNSQAVYNSEVRVLESKEDFYQFLRYLGLVFFSAGLWYWHDLQMRQNKIAELEYNKAMRQYLECQSCGTQLLYTEIVDGKIYCKFCHNGYSFIDPYLNRIGMKERIRERMASVGFKEDEIKKQTDKVDVLFRWNRRFRWD